MKSKFAKISKKRWDDMTLAEKEAEFKELDKPINPRDAKPLTTKQRLLHERMLGNHPAVSYKLANGRSDIIIRLDDELMGRVRSFARKNKTSVPKMIDRGLRGLLSFAQ